MNQRPGFCTQCRAPLDPGDDSEECASCHDDYSQPWIDDWTWYRFEWWTAHHQDGEPPEKPAISSTAVRVLTMSEIVSLQQNKRETTERLMALMGSTVKIV